jgi:hypothetical protein
VEINVNEELAKAKKEMNEAEDALVEAGFSEDQWMLIKQYILSAILHNQLIHLRTIQEM